MELGLPNLVSIDFTDGTTLNFQLELDLKSRVELLTLKAGNITDVKRLRPASVVRRGRVPQQALMYFQDDEPTRTTQS